MKIIKLGRALRGALPFVFLLGTFLLTGFTFAHNDTPDIFDNPLVEDIWDISNPIEDIWSSSTAEFPTADGSTESEQGTSNEEIQDIPTAPTTFANETSTPSSWYILKQEWGEISPDRYNDFEVLYTIGAVWIDNNSGFWDLDFFYI